MRILFFIIIVLLFYLVYGVCKQDFAKKNHSMMIKYFPSFLVWPKNPEVYEKLYKIVLLLFLAIFIVLFIIG